MSLSIIDVREYYYKLFSTIAIETSSWCNRRCAFCPVSYSPRPRHGRMDIELIRHVLDQLHDLSYTGRIELYIYNEPLYDDRIRDIIFMVRTNVPRACIMLSTNGDALHDESGAYELFENGLNQLCINVYSEARHGVLAEVVSGQ